MSRKAGIVPCEQPVRSVLNQKIRQINWAENAKVLASLFSPYSLNKARYDPIAGLEFYTNFLGAGASCNRENIGRKIRDRRIYTDLRQLKSHFINMTIAWG